jgi:hypothetical protein
MRARFPIIERPLRELRPEQKKPPEALLGRVCTETGDCVFLPQRSFTLPQACPIPCGVHRAFAVELHHGNDSLGEGRFHQSHPGRLHRHRGHGAFAQLRGERLPRSMKKVKPVFVSVQVSDS